MERLSLAFPTLRVLAFESEKCEASPLVAALQALGVFQTTKAENVAGAVRMLSTEPGKFDVVIFDLDIDTMDSIELVRQASENSAQAFILMSSHDEALQSSVNAFARRYRLNVLGVLAKPVTNHNLATLLSLYSRGGNQIIDHNGPSTSPWTREDLARALEREQFIPFFQPQIELATGNVTSVEVLARWNHPELGMLLPSQFINVMEREGLLNRLFDSLLRQSLMHARQWDMRGWPIGLAINASPSTLQNNALPSHVSEMARQYRICPERVTLEVTETAMTEDPGRLLETLIRLRLRGFKLSVDDFGTGYSSLQQLSDIPFTEIKIDRSLIAGISQRRKAILILESILGLANKLGMDTVAEGIESETDHDLIQALGCKYGQSYYFARPMGNAELERHLGRNHRLHLAQASRHVLRAGA